MVMTRDVLVKDTCKYLGIGRATLYRLDTEKRLTSYKIAQRRYYKRADIEAYKNCQRRIKYPDRVFTFALMTRYHQVRQNIGLSLRIRVMSVS